MAKKSSKGEGSEFFRPCTPTVCTRRDCEEEDLSGSQSKGFSRSENAILAALEKVNERLAKVKRGVQSLEVKLGEMDTRLKQMERKTASFDRRISSLEPQLVTLQEAQKGFDDFQAKAIQSFVRMDEFREHLEKERRGNTSRILGFSGGQSGSELAKEIGDFLTEHLDPNGDKTSIPPDKVYRLPMRKNEKGENRDGTVMVTLRDRETRELILRKATRARNLVSEGKKVLIFPDVGPLTVSKRKELLELRKKFLDIGAQASLWAPARLCIRHLNKQYAFTDPNAAQKLLESLSE